jgi:hypothetical protein
MRLECFLAMGRAYVGAGRAATEAMVREGLKLGKAGLADKLPVIQCAAARVGPCAARGAHGCSALGVS